LAKYMSGELLPPQQQQLVAAPVQAPSHPPTRIVEIRNMITKQDIDDDQEYADIIEDTQQECSHFGQLLRVVIPRDKTSSEDPRVFLEYSNSDEASAAIRELQGRTFDGRQVQAAFFDEDKFSRQEYGS
jgi:splicing factor U2AF 65 kDa subunit